MPFGLVAPLIAGAVSSGASLFSNLNNAAQQRKMNLQQQQWNEQQYEKQKQDSITMWNTQNEYNSPAAQMRRLKEAGLNPNLVYGKGADNTAMAISRPTVAPWNPKAPSTDLGGVVSNGLMAYYDVQMKSAQIDNLKVQNTVALQEAALKAAQTANTAALTDRTKFDLGMSQTLKQNSLEMASESLRQMRTGTDIRLAENERAAAMNASNLNEAAARIAKIRAELTLVPHEKQRLLSQIKNLETDNRLKVLDENLKKNGVQPGDNIWFRVLSQFLANWGFNLGALGDQGPKQTLGADVLNPLFAKPGGWRK